MGRIGLWADCSLAPARGSTVLTAFMAMWTTAMIRATVTMDRCPGGEHSNSTTSRRTKRETDTATWATLPTMAVMNTLYLDFMVAAPRTAAAVDVKAR
jgi:hypothetical protein